MVSKNPAYSRVLVISVLMVFTTGLSGYVFAASLDYEVVAAKGKLLRESPQPEARLQVGDVEHSGALLRTGWRSSAGLEEKSLGATFELASRTRVSLGGDRPGILLELQKGRLRAIFEKMSAGESAERTVTTPSAVLTVRGTDYAVEVDGSGNTTVVVFDGEVEVLDLDRLGPPVRLSAGTSCSVPRGQRPGQVAPHSLSSQTWNHGRMPATAPSGTGSAGVPGGNQSGSQHRNTGGGNRHGGGS